MNPILRRVAALSALALTTASCEDATAPQYGRLNLRLTDAPGDVVTAMVTIDRIYLQPTDGGDEGRIILREEDVTVDLLTLADSYADLITGAEIPAGTYTQLRFVISGAYLEVEGATANTIFASSPTYDGLPDGATVGGDLQMPSLASSGLKIKLPGDAISIAPDETVTLVVDFDVAQSFGKQAGASGKWVMHPVVTATVPPPAAP